MYGQKQAINQSSFKYINPEEGGSPELFYDFIMGNIEQKETSWMITGTMVHKALFEPEEFVVAEIPAISDNIKSIVDKVFASAVTNDIDLTMLDLRDFEHEITGAAKAINFGQSWKPETLVSKVVEGGEEYFNVMKQGRDKIILTTKQKATIDKIVHSIQANSYLKNTYINPDPSRYDYLYELPLYFQLDMPDYTLDCKAKLDCLILDKKEKTFIIVDLKTTSDSIENFDSIFSNRRMYRQLAFYEAAVRKNYVGYTPLNHCILGVESTGYNRVRRFNIGKTFIDKGIEEYMEICARIAWHFSTNNWSISVEDYENDFVRFLHIKPELN